MEQKPVGEIQCYASYGPVHWGVDQAEQLWEKWEVWGKWEPMKNKKIKQD